MTLRARVAALSVLLLCSGLTSTTNALPVELDCPQGGDAVGPYIDDATLSGSLQDGDLDLYIDGIPLSIGTMTIKAGQTYEIELVSGDGEDDAPAFTEFLIRLGGGDEMIDTTEAFLVPDEMLEDVHVAAKCVEEYAVGGLTHLPARNPHTYAMAELYLQEASSDMAIDVTVVMKKDEDNEEESIYYYYSQFKVDVIEEEHQEEVSGEEDMDPDEGPGPDSDEDPGPDSDEGPGPGPDSDEGQRPDSDEGPPDSDEGPPDSDEGPGPDSDEGPNSDSDERPDSDSDEGADSDSKDDPTSIPSTMNPSDYDSTGAPSESPQRSSMTSSPTESYDDETTSNNIDIDGSCGNFYSWGVLQAGECYAADLVWCGYINNDDDTAGGSCKETYSEWSYYNGDDDNSVDFNSNTYYGAVSIYADHCADDCEVYVEDYLCQATCTGTEDVTVTSCNGLPNDSIQFEYFPQTVNAEYGIFDMKSTDAMCEHPSVGPQRHGQIRSGPGATSVAKSKSGGRKKVMTIPTELNLWFHNEGGDLEDLYRGLVANVPARTQLLTKTMEFFMTRLASDANFAQTIKDVTIGQIDGLTVVSSDQLMVNFDTVVELDAAATGDMRQAITTLANSDWFEDYMKPFRANTPHAPAVANVLKKIRKVTYKGIGRGAIEEQ